MNLSKHSVDKELFSGTLVEENTKFMKKILYLHYVLINSFYYYTIIIYNYTIIIYNYFYKLLFFKFIILIKYTIKYTIKVYFLY